MKAHWLDQFEREQDDRFMEFAPYTPPHNPLENLSTVQLLEKIERCLGASIRPYWNELKTRITDNTILNFER